MVPLDFYRQPTSPPATGCQDTWTRRIEDKGLEKDPDQMSNIKVTICFAVPRKPNVWILILWIGDGNKDFVLGSFWLRKQPNKS